THVPSTNLATESRASFIRQSQSTDRSDRGRVFLPNRRPPIGRNQATGGSAGEEDRDASQYGGPLLPRQDVAGRQPDGGRCHSDRVGAKRDGRGAREGGRRCSVDLGTLGSIFDRGHWFRRGGSGESVDLPGTVQSEHDGRYFV